MTLAILDPTAILNIGISVTIGSIIATFIVWLLISYFIKKSLLSILKDKKVHNALEQFIEKNIVQSFNNMQNVELKRLITETAEMSLEVAIKKLEEKKQFG
jgi:peptide subunit release factor RF-3